MGRYIKDFFKVVLLHRGRGYRGEGRERAKKIKYRRALPKRPMRPKKRKKPHYH